MKRVFTVIGAGNGGQAMAAHLTMSGHEVHLYDIDRERMKELSEKRTITLSGQLEGEQRIALITEHMKEALRDSAAVFVVTTATAHNEVAEEMGKYLRSRQAVILCPGQTGGGIIVRNILRRSGKSNPVIELQDLMYACRLKANGAVNVSAVKKEVEAAAFCEEEYTYVYQMIKDAYPQVRRGPNMLYTGFNNMGVILHPAPMLLNAGRVESGEEFLFYHQGITPAVAECMEQMDQERIAAGRAYGIPVTPLGQWLKEIYGVEGGSLYERIHNNPAYASVKAPASLMHRFITEDVPSGLVPIVELGERAGTDMPVMRGIAELAGKILKQDFYKTGRNLKMLGLESKDVPEIKRMFMNEEGSV